MLRKYTLVAGLLALFLAGVGCGGPHRHTGRLGASWRIVDSRTNIEGDCQWAGISEVELAARDTYTGEDHYFSFDCNAYQGVSYPLVESEYAVALYGYSPTGEGLSYVTWPTGTTFPVYGGETTPVSGILYYP